MTSRRPLNPRWYQPKDKPGVWRSWSDLAWALVLPLVLLGLVLALGWLVIGSALSWFGLGGF